MPATPITASRTTRGYTALAVAGTLVLLLAVARLIVFGQADAPLSAIGWSVTPWNAFITQHSCATAYWIAATEVDRAPDIYHPRTYSLGRSADGRDIPRTLGPYPVDPYEYPPTFLLLPRLLARVTPEFSSFRLLWGALNMGIVIAGVAWVARRIDRENAAKSIWLVPLVLVPLGVGSTFQMGNAQLLFVTIAMLAMLAFERGSHPLGGLLLGCAIVGKLFPGLLVVYLLARREWRAVAWTSAWGGVLTLVAIADLGWAPFAHFFDHLPRLMSGEAFPMLRVPGPPNVSLSVPGVVLKLPAFGAPALPFASLKIAGWIFTAIIVWATVRLALRPLVHRLAPLAWLVVLGLATLRSPFLPGYGVFQGVWIGAILLALCWADTRRRWWVLGLWAVLLPTALGPSSIPPVVVAGMTTLQSVAILILCGLAVRVGREAACNLCSTSCSQR